jgi:hypothetical protein
MYQLTPEQINIEWLENLTMADLKAFGKSYGLGSPQAEAFNALLQTPEGRKIGYEILNDPDYVPKSKRQADPEEAAQIAADEAQSAEQAAAQEQAAAELASASQDTQVAAEAEARNLKNASEDAEARKVGAVIHRGANGEIEKVVIDYQVRNESGQPIGRPTHFEGRSLVEVLAKAVTAHTNAVAYGERIKANRVKQSQLEQEYSKRDQAVQTTQADVDRMIQEGITENNPAKVGEAVKAGVKAGLDQQAMERAAAQHGHIVAKTWIADHQDDFLPCAASSEIMGKYLKENGLQVSYDNLETAFQATKHLLPVKPQVEPNFAASTNNPPTAAAVTPAAQAAPIAQPAAVATAQETQGESVPPPATVTPQQSTPVAANKPTATRRPGVNGSLQPGSLSAARPSVESSQQTSAETRSQLLREIGKMDPAIYRRKLNDPKFVEKLEAAGIRVIGNRR